ENENTVYNAAFDRDVEYSLYEQDGDFHIYFAGPTTGYGYQIKKISEKEVVIKGLKRGSFEDHSGYLERKMDDNAYEPHKTKHFGYLTLNIRSERRST